MANPKLEAFLAANEPDPPPAPTEAPEPPATPPASEPAPEPKPAPAPSEAPDAPDDDADVSGGPSVPRQALLDERSKRQDWKDRAARAETLAEQRRQQLEQLQKEREAAARPQQAEPQFQFADPQREPALYAAQQAQNAVYNVSEMMARRQHGDEVVDKAVEEFIGLARNDPMLWHKMQQQRDPFEFVRREVERQKLLREIEDPEQYKAKLRAEWEAERATQMPPAVATPSNMPPPNMPPSLAGVRSVAGRAAQAWTGPPSDQQIAADIRAHRMAMRQR